MIQRLTALCAVACFAPVTPAHAGIPNRTVTIEIHSDGYDPQSPVLFRVKLALQVQSVLHHKNDPGGTITWWINTVTVDELATGRSWKETFEDKTWSTAHVDLEALDTAEFSEPPHLSGIADPTDAGEPLLDYDLDALAGGTPVYTTTTYFDYMIKILSGAVLKSGQDEPTEVFDDEDEE